MLNVILFSIFGFFLFFTYILSSIYFYIINLSVNFILLILYYIVFLYFPYSYTVFMPYLFFLFLLNISFLFIRFFCDVIFLRLFFFKNYFYPFLKDIYPFFLRPFFYFISLLFFGFYLLHLFSVLFFYISLSSLLPFVLSYQLFFEYVTELLQLDDFWYEREPYIKYWSIVILAFYIFSCFSVLFYWSFFLKRIKNILNKKYNTTNNTFLFFLLCYFGKFYIFFFFLIFLNIHLYLFFLILSYNLIYFFFLNMFIFLFFNFFFILWFFFNLYISKNSLNNLKYKLKKTNIFEMLLFKKLLNIKDYNNNNISFFRLWSSFGIVSTPWFYKKNRYAYLEEYISKRMDNMFENKMKIFASIIVFVFYVLNIFSFILFYFPFFI